MRPPDLALAVLVVVNVGLAGAGWGRARPTTYVFTPLVDVVPGTVDGAAVAALGTGVQHDVDARDLQGAYARLGATLSLDDLLRGIEELDDLTPTQEGRLAGLLGDAQADRAAVLDLQREILDLEASIARQVVEIDPAMGTGSGP